ncbi:serine protease Do [Rhodanobacter sp. ANJX3]|uniref:DegQ family serine endoprotease n=1 Tax=unclassified Rhodanobacter TaxID=2621553 RepID=UPI0015CCFD6B|nr:MULTISPECIES: DegQ family serine endoprotease [unclassified Rhodanobacter]MBB5357426.1 serine protease Do [Rhodanobacter sp. ANJX3]NYE27474.1 serine protease Do [Rhodanobacter sp. K2T2]
MKFPVLRTLACGVSLSLAVATGSAWAQTTTMATGGLPDFTGIVERNAPAVVHVEAKYNGKSRKPSRASTDPDQDGSPDDPQAEMFRRFFGMPMMPSPEDQKHTSLGSGFIISRDGYVLTNNHVVDGADEVTVRLQDRRTFTAKVVGTDPKYDIAVLKINDGDNLPAVSVGDSRTLKAGQWVLAIGSPFGFDYTVTQGIVSAVGRNLGSADQPYTSFIQTDVPINRGNSGGPLFNLQGQVVGVNSQIYSSTGGYQGVAFSIPIDVAMSAVEQIKAHGFVTRGQLGVHVGPLSDDVVKALKLPNANGAIVSDVDAGSAAGKAGIQQGDIIVGYNGQPISQAPDLPPLVGLTKPGTKATLDIIRDGKKITIPVVVGAAPRDDKTLSSASDGGSASAPSGSTALGLSVQNIDAATRQQLGLKSGEGVQIGGITGRAAASAGLQQGDIILMVNQQRVGNVTAFQAATKGLKAGDTVLLLVRRGDQSQFIGLTVPDGK